MKVRLYGSLKQDVNQNYGIFNATTNFVLKSERFFAPLL